MAVPFVHSGYQRKPDDDYQTVDPRCLRALLDTWEIDGTIVDCCARNGSALMEQLAGMGHGTPRCCETVHFTDPADWIVTNPPYMRDVVDQIANAAVEHVRRGQVMGAAFLMRANWDLAARRSALFSSPLYAGQTRMRFRPWWSAERKAQPVHNFSWHVWCRFPAGREPVIRYWPKA